MKGNSDPASSFSSPLLALPMLAVLAFVFIVPMLSLILLSFRTMTGPAQVSDDFSLDNYRQFLTDFFYIKAFLNTVVLGAAVSFICLVVALPISYFLARTSSRWRGPLVLLVVSPLLVSAVVRNVGWYPILGNTGMINWFLQNMGLTRSPVALISNTTGVIIGLVHALLPFMILIVTNVIQRIHPELEEAAANLGAGPVQRFFRVLVPLMMPGIVAGSLLTFTIAIAAFTTPVIMSGNHVLLMSTFIAQQFRTVLDYPLGATAAALLMLFVIVLASVAVRLSRSGAAR